MVKKCGSCQLEKPDEDFARHRKRPTGRQDWCRPCMTGANRTWRYGSEFTPEVFEALLASQDYQCGICGGALTLDRNTHVDHCHITGQIRGVLCGQCNTGLGLFRDDPELLTQARNYLMGHNGKEFSKAVG